MCGVCVPFADQAAHTSGAKFDMSMAPGGISAELRLELLAWA